MKIKKISRLGETLCKAKLKLIKGGVEEPVTTSAPDCEGGQIFSLEEEICIEPTFPGEATVGACSNIGFP